MNNLPDDKNQRVLIIDDNRSIHDDFRKILSSATVAATALDVTEAELFGEPTHGARQIPYEIDSAYQGQEGVQMVQQARDAGRPYALAFVDIRMPPGWDGVETTQRIWAIDPEIQIVLCTAYSDYSWDEMFEKIGRSDGLVVLKKPFDTVEALQLAQALTEKWWLHRQSQQKMEELESRVAKRTRELQQTNDTLQRQQAELRVLFDLMPAMIWFKDTQNRILRVNQRVAETAGKPIAEIEGKPSLEIYPEEAAGYYADDLEVIRSGVPKLGYVEKIRGSQGEELWVQTDKVPYCDQEGKVIGIVVMAQDITERQRAAEALRTSMEEFRTLAEAMPQIVWVTRPDGWCDYLNQQWMDYTGLTLEESLGYEWNRTFHPEDQQRSWEAWHLAVATASTYLIESRLRRADGVYRWWLIRAVPLRDAAGHILKWFGTSTDVHDLKLAGLEIQQLNADLELRVAQRTEDLFLATLEANRANRAKSEFLSRTSHELRTPMNAILGFGQLLEMEENLGPEPRESVGEILKAGRHLLSLIDEVLDISTAESGRMTLSLEPVAVDQMVQETLERVRPLGAAHRVEVELLSSFSGRVLADRQRLQQVLRNLLSNALQYNRPGGRVTMECVRAQATDRPALRICIKDNGPGISAANLTRLFTPFDRLDAERTSTHAASPGLGLALSKRMVELMGGRIGVESVVGEGSLFWVEIPLA